MKKRLFILLLGLFTLAKLELAAQIFGESNPLKNIQYTYTTSLSQCSTWSATNAACLIIDSYTSTQCNVRWTCEGSNTLKVSSCLNGTSSTLAVQIKPNDIVGSINTIINTQYTYKTTLSGCTWSASDASSIIIDAQSSTQCTVRWQSIGANTLQASCANNTKGSLQVAVGYTLKTPKLYDKKMSYSYSASGQRILRQEVVIPVTQILKAGQETDTSALARTVPPVQPVIDDTDSSLQVSLYPNPVDKILTMELTANNIAMPVATVQLSTSNGLPLQNLQTATGNLSIDMSAYSAGYYILNINYNGKTSSWTVIKQ